MGARYWELGLAAPADAVEGLANFLWEQGALGVIEEQAAGGHPHLRAFFAPDSNLDRLEGDIREYVTGLTALGFSSPFDGGGEATRIRLTPVVDPNWAASWREHFRPRAIGRRLLVVPPWEADVEAGSRLLIVIEPGRAFGTGHHGSTAGCLERLEAIVEADGPAAALDLGTGSGILAVAAARLGVARVLAVDDDPDAVACARANFVLNAVADRAVCRLADAAALATDPVPLVLANLLTTTHRRLAPRYRQLVAAGGRLVLGGVLDAEASGVRAALGEHGFVPHATCSLEGWTTLDFRRMADDADATVHDRA